MLEAIKDMHGNEVGPGDVLRTPDGRHLRVVLSFKRVSTYAAKTPPSDTVEMLRTFAKKCERVSA